MAHELKPCPFCGGQPHFEGDASKWRDESRYVELSLVCCATMNESIGWRRARDMQPQERDQELRDRLATAWNRRAPVEHSDT